MSARLPIGIADPNANEKFIVLIAEDNPDDAFFLNWALRSIDCRNSVRIVTDGAEAIAYLEGQGDFSDRTQFPFPNAIIIDLNMPRKSGLEVLDWLQQHPEKRALPMLVLSSGAHCNDIVSSYRLGAHSFMVKPGRFEDLQRMLQLMNRYWKLPVPIEEPTFAPS